MVLEELFKEVANVNTITGIFTFLEIPNAQNMVYMCIIFTMIGLVAYELFYAMFMTKYNKNWQNLSLIPKIFISLFSGAFAFYPLFFIYIILKLSNIAYNSFALSILPVYASLLISYYAE